MILCPSCGLVPVKDYEDLCGMCDEMLKQHTSPTTKEVVLVS